MRVLIATQDKNFERHLKSVFMAAGYNVDSSGYKKPKDIRDYIMGTAGSPFSLVVGDQAINYPDVVGKNIARLDIALTKEFEGCSMGTVTSDEKDEQILRKADLRWDMHMACHQTGLFRQGRSRLI